MSGLPPAWSPLALALFSLSFMLLAYPAGALSDRIDPKSLLLGGIALLVAADLWLAQAAACGRWSPASSCGARIWR